MDDNRTRHAPADQVHDLWSALYNMKLEIEQLTTRLERVEGAPEVSKGSATSGASVSSH